MIFPLSRMSECLRRLILWHWIRRARICVESSVLGENLKEHGNHEGYYHFYMTHPDTEWKSCIAHAIKLELGTDKYELVQI